MMNKKNSYRDVFRMGTVLVLVFVLGVSFTLGTRPAEAASEIVVAVFPGSWEEAFMKIVAPYLKRTADVDLVVTGALAQDQLGKMMASPDRPAFDALLMSPGQSAVAKENGLIQKVDPQLIPNWSELSQKTFQDEWGPAVTVQVDGIAYNPEKVPRPNGYADLFKPEYYGKVAWSGFESNTSTMAWVLIAKILGGSEDNMEPLWKKIEEELPHFGAIANNMNHQQSLFQQGEIDVMIASTNNVTRLKSLGVSIEFVHPETGSPAVPVNIHITKGTQDPKAVHAYINAVLSHEVQAALEQPPIENFPTNGTVPITPSVAQYMTREQLSKFVYLDWAKINKHRAEWIERFNQVVKK
jgi:putative spermidine/putrescine transport system substrate-binding protein